MRDLACVIHVHSTWSDGTGTVPQIMRAAAKAGVDVVLLTDHDNLAARDHGQEGWHGDVLLLVGEEVTPAENHYLAFGIDTVITKSGRTPAEVCEAVEAQGGFGFAAHPFSEGSKLFKRRGMPFHDLDCVKGLELWSFVNDTGEAIERSATCRVPGFAEPLHRPPARPQPAHVGRAVPQAAGRGDRRARRAPGRDPRGPLGAPAADVVQALVPPHPHARADRRRAEPRDRVRSAARGRCYIAMDSLAPARGFTFESDGDAASASGSREARIRLLRDGAEVATASGRELEHAVEAPGAYRVEAYLPAYGKERTWILTNPIYVASRQSL